MSNFRCFITAIGKRYGGLFNSLIELGYKVETWNVDKEILHHKDGFIGSIILLRVHTPHMATGDFADALKKALLANDVQFVSLLVLNSNDVAIFRTSVVPFSKGDKPVDSAYRD